MERFSEKLKKKTERCEASIGSAIFSAQPTEKLKALDAGIDKWQKALCAAAIKYYDTCFELGRRNRADLGGKQPAEFAYGLTAMALSRFLRMNLLDGPEENSHSRVRQFIRDVCGPPDVDVDNLPDLSLDPAPTSDFHLPWWAAKYSFGDRIAGHPKPPAMGTLGAEQSEKIILVKETKLTAGLLNALSHARRKLLIATGMSTSSSSKQEPLVGNEREASGHTAGRAETSRRKRTTRPKDSMVESRRKKIQEVAALNVVGEEYCKALDERNIQTPYRWQASEGCPKRYLEAFTLKDRTLRKKWRQRIADEKSKATSKQRERH